MAESIVCKIFEDYNVSANINLLYCCCFIKLSIFPCQIFYERALAENAVKYFLRNGYYLGFVDVNQDGSFDINHSIKQKFIEEQKPLES